MNRKWLFLSLLLFISSSAYCSPFSQRQIRSVTAAAFFVSRDTQAPSIIHTGLSQVSKYNPVAIIEGTARDNHALAKVVIYYKMDDTDISTKTYTISSGKRAPLTPGTTMFHFSFNASDFLVQHANTSQKFLYAVCSEDEAGNFSVWSDNSPPQTGFVKYRMALPIPSSSLFKEVELGCKAQSVVGKAGGIIALSNGNPNDGQTSVEFSLGALKEDVVISISEISPDDPLFSSARTSFYSQKPVSVYKFEPEGLSFNSIVKLNLLYQDVNRDGLVDGTKFREDSLKIMWWDGFEWRVMGGKLDKEKKILTVNISHFSVYGIFPAGAFTDADYMPKEKIITPVLSDTRYNCANFSALDVNSGEYVTIFDITGKRIRKLTDTNSWDGKDDSGSVVESGLYIYQIKKSDKIISGTIVVAK